jgi:hypothetical protein
MANKTFEVKGFDQLAEQLNVLFSFYNPEEVLKKGTVNSVRKALQPMLSRVVANAPYDNETNKSGIHLRDTAKVQVRLPNEKDKQSQFYYPGDVVWGLVSVKKSAVSLSQEFGNANTPAHPYLRVSFESGADESLNILKEQLSHQLKSFLKNVTPMV